MKRLIQKTIIAATVAVAFVQAHASQMPSWTLHAPLETFNLHSDHAAGNKVIGGDVVVNLEKKVITLTVQQTIDCPPGMACIALAPAPLRVHLPLISEQVSACGDIVYIAQRNDLPVDGGLETLTVVDHTQNECPTLIILPATSISYETYYMSRIPGHPNHQAVSTFTAGPLQGLNWILPVE
ncbi:MAG: hypothetical protein H6624_18345 [Bdellovibrionaceae bacterium]|nr:hypothetical protein [Bdellovibrionales bacterium]MCB9086305.1 hypothetical protein [Pseudobdellovibrionaceae bacterium]